MNGQGSQYEILQKLGEGGMGMVYLAKDTIIQRLVAIKQLHLNSGSEDESLGERFQAEALALAKLNHPNVTHLYSFIPKEDSYWMIMEYVEGKTLEDWIFIHKKITHQLAVSIAIQILDGLYHAHRKEIIHRDIKPANVMINEEGEVKIMDFGIARMRNDQRLTSHGKSVGTLEYMAPEQIQGHEGDERTDVYAVGNILYEMLCGSTPFQSDTDYILMKDKLEKQPDSIIKENPSVPESLEKIIFKALQRNPKKRYQSALKLKNALKKCLEGSLLDESELTEALNVSQVFTVPQKENEIISVNKILSHAKSISGRFKVPEVGKINKSVIILIASVLLCTTLLFWNGGGDSGNIKTDDTPETPTVTWVEHVEEPQQSFEEQSTDDFEETPSEMYKRIALPKSETTKPKKSNRNSVKKNVSNSSENASSKTTERSKPVEKDEKIKKENVVEKRRVSYRPEKVPAGRIISVTLIEDVTSEKKELDGTLIKLICNDDVVVNNRIIIRKGAEVIGKIVDCIPSKVSNRKALIGFVILKVKAVDGSIVKLRSIRYKLFSEVFDKPAIYRSGQTFEAKLRKGKVY